jgi:hypothetical protein
LCIEGKCNMRELMRWSARTLVSIVLLGALWPWAIPYYTGALAGLTDAVFFALHQPFGARATAEGVQLSWQPLRYISAEHLQQQMGYVDRFARQGLQGYGLITVKTLYLQWGVLLTLALVWAGAGLSGRERLRRAVFALGALLVGQAFNLVLSAQIEFQLRSRTLSTPEVLAVLQDPEWYMYYGLRPLPIVLDYLLPWVVSWWVAAPMRSLLARGAPYETQRA